MTEHDRAKAASRVAEDYYDSGDADQFYFNVWGGEDIHIGLYESEQDDIAAASRKTVEQLASLLDGTAQGARVIDFGAGYGGAARHLARRFGAFVTALNLSEVQNQRNRELCRQWQLADQVEVLHASFENVPKPDQSYDVVWSQDAILHSGDRQRVLSEARWVLRPGGTLIFTDPMQSDECPSDALSAVYQRIHLESLGSFGFYRKAAAQAGFREVACLDLSQHLPRHYARVHAELSRRYDELVKLASRDYVDRMLEGLLAWVDAGRRGHLAWGILKFAAA